MRSRFALLVILLGLGPLVAPPASARSRRKKPHKHKCDSTRYKCVGKTPKYYDKLVRITHRPTKGQDRACLKRLKAAGIRFRMLTHVKGVKTPVQVLSGKLGGVRYRKAWNNKRRFVLDCHMVEVLVSAGPAIRKAGIATIYFTSSWRYSIVHGSNRLSKHAHGDAMDITAIDGAFGYASVVRHYEKGRWGCGSRNKTKRGKAWRQFYCALKQNRAFRTIYTPDTDRYHRDHFHVERPNPYTRLKPRKRRRRRRRR